MKEYINCEHAMRTSCPHRLHESMLVLLSGDKNNNLTQEIIDNANSLCKDCDKFTPNPQK